MKKILVLFKTHLDVGFTDFAGEIVRKYNEEYIPGALSVGEKLMNTQEGFVWTTGSWLIWQYLKNARPEARERMERAIGNGIISWHGLPVTLHSEAAGLGLFEYGLSLSAELDRRFGVQTTGAKFTDVPGHTIGIVPPLARAGIKLLHIGVNSASSAPECPDLFRWRAPGGEEIAVMYNKGGYGEFTLVPGTDTGVLFAHTNDNCGPQSAEEILELYRRLHEEYPGVEIKAGNLNDVARLVESVRDSLPVFTREIGDTWIHGVGADPRKMNGYRGLLRAALNWSREDREALYESLLLIPEHTWGLDEKTHLNDHDNFSREKFGAARGGRGFLKMERSWAEQREYLTKNLSRLSAPAGAEAEGILQEYKKDYPCARGCERLHADKTEINGWKVEIGAGGGFRRLSKGDTVFEGSVCSFMYQAFSAGEVDAFGRRYRTQDIGWALEDFGKIGLRGQMDTPVKVNASVTGVYRQDNRLLMELSGDERAYRELGCPKRFTLEAVFHENRVDFDFAWYEKPASRIPEALWLRFDLGQSLKAVGKLGLKVDPREVVSKGNRELHCTDGRVFFERAALTCVDSPLISIEKPFVYGFYNEIPSMEKGVWVNLFNNQWGTNFPMWYEDDARFRFTLEAVKQP